MGWESSDRRERLPEDWDRRRADRLKKDDYRCTWKLDSGRRCPRRATDVDHRRPGDDHSQGNLRSLCQTHHKKKTAVEAVAARKKGSRERVREEHPGRLS